MSAKFWLVIQIGLDGILILLFIFLIRHVRRLSRADGSGQLSEMTHSVESVLNDARNVAGEFETQLKEKKAIIGRLNEQLDHRIINLNLLLTRTDSNGPSLGDGKNRTSDPGKNTYDLQNEIIALSEKGLSPSKIAEKLGVIKGEVNLVLDLKKKFLEMKSETAKM